MIKNTSVRPTGWPQLCLNTQKGPRHMHNYACMTSITETKHQTASTFGAQLLNAFYRMLSALLSSVFFSTHCLYMILFTISYELNIFLHALPDCYTGIMCYSAGHDGFSSFDNTLFLRGGCNSGASCGDKGNGEEQILGKTCYR